MPIGRSSSILTLAAGLLGGPPPAVAQGASEPPPPAIDCDAFEAAADGSWTVRARTRIGRGAAARTLEPGVRVGGPGADPSTADVARALQSCGGGLY